MRVLLILLVALLPLAARAQEDDRGWLTGRIESLLSDAGREVRIEGFAGALSSRATFTRLTIADDRGVWLTIEGGAIQWSRSALLSGRIEIEELAAAEILIPRPPDTGPDRPSAEAREFSLPVLPVSVRIGRIAADRVVLGAPLIGQEVTLSLSGALELAGGSGSAVLGVTRAGEGPEGRLSLNAGYEADTRRVRLDLLLEEGPGGIAASTLGLPGAPAVTLAVAGTGPVADLTTEIALSTDGVRRLDGTLELLTENGTRRFLAELSGDVAPLVAPDLRAFFGDGVALVAEGQRRATGQMELSRLTLETAGLRLDGSLALAPGGWPERFELDLAIGGEDVTRLPLPAEVRLRSATARLSYDANDGREGWRLRADLAGLSHPALDLAALRLEGSGRITRGQGSAPPAVGGRIRAAAGGLRWADPALAEALGPFLTAGTVFHWQEDDPLALRELRIIGRDLGASGQAELSAAGTAVTLSGAVEARLANLARFAALAGRPLSGAAEGRVEGSYDLLSGTADVTARLVGQDVAVGDARLDRALAGTSAIALSARRDTAGTEVRDFALEAGPLSASAAGRVATGAADFVAEARLDDLARLDPAWRGAAETTLFWRLGDGAARLTLTASAENLGFGAPQVDRFLGGDSRLELALAGPEGDIWLEAARLTSPQLSLALEGAGATGARQVTGEARLRDFALIAPEFSGPLTLAGRATETAAGFDVDLTGTGPGGTQARIAGSVAEAGQRLALALTGQAQAALANPFLGARSISGPLSFDLAVNGPPALESLSGSVRLDGGRFAAPALHLVLEGIGATARIDGARATLDAQAGVQGGGRVALSGSLGLTGALPADLAVTLDAAAVQDPELYRATLDGRLGISGPLAGGARIAGALTIPEAEIRVPEALPPGSGLLPGLDHRAEPAPVRATRARAGLLAADDGTGGTVAAFPLDIAVEAPRRIFVRGRGLEAELGGRLVLGGTTADVQASGRFDLIRGRLDLLGKRFTLDQGTIGLQGTLDPFLRFAATTTGGDIAATIGIEGPASAPEITFTSSPALPEEEVVARILFGQSVSSLSPLQAARLAAAVASLAGYGGEGVVGRLRQGFGLDDLDIATAGDGTTELRLGKYLSDNIYTDVTVGSDGQSRINLNLDLRPGLTARGTVGSDGETGVGLFYQRDY